MKLIPLPKKDIKDGETALTAGWGTLDSPKTPMPEDLKKLQVTVIDQQLCEKKYSEFEGFKISPLIACTSNELGVGICQVIIFLIIFLL